MEAVKGSQPDRCGHPWGGLPREPPGVHAPLQPHHRCLGQHSPLHCSAVVGDPWRPDSHLPTPSPTPPLPLEGPVRCCALRAPRTNGAAGPHPGTFLGRSQGREVLSAPWDPSNCHQRPRPWECGTQLVQQRHLCQQAVKKRGSPPVMPGAHPSLCVRSRGTGGQRVSVTRRMRGPAPLLPGGLSVRLSWPAPPGLEHQATLAPHTQGPAPAHTPARVRAYTQDDGIFRPPALRRGLVAVDSPLSVRTGQSGCSASWWGREGSPHPRACSCMRPPAQPNPTPLPTPATATAEAATQHDPVQTLVNIPISKRPVIHPPQTTTTAGQTDTGTWNPSTTVTVKAGPRPAPPAHHIVQPQGLRTMPDPPPPQGGREYPQGVQGAYPQHQPHHY